MAEPVTFVEALFGRHILVPSKSVDFFAQSCPTPRLGPMPKASRTTKKFAREPTRADRYAIPALQKAMEILELLANTSGGLTLPLPDEKRRELRKRLLSFASTVDGVISGEVQEAAPQFMDYARNVERAASDLGARRARHETLGFEIQDIFK